MQPTSHGRQCTGDDQGGSDGQAADGRPNSPSLLPHQRRGLLHHLDLGVQQLQARLRLRRGEVGLPESLDLQHGVATREERPRREDGGDNGDGESNLEDHLARHGNLRRSTETHQHTSEPQDDASLAIETLGVRVHRLALCSNLRKNDDQRGELLIVVHPDEGTRSLCQPSRDARKSSADLPGKFESATADRTRTAMTSGKTCGFAGGP